MVEHVWRRTWRPGPVLVIEERADAGRALYARWWEPAEAGCGRWRRRALGRRLRGAGSGVVDPAAEREVLVIGDRMHRELVAGRDPAGALDAGRTVERVLDAYLRSETEGLSRRHRGDLKRAARVLAEVLGPDTPWSALTAAAGRTVWRTMADRSPDGRGESWAIRTVELLWRVGAWVALDEGLAVGTALAAPSRWRQAMRADWARSARQGGVELAPRRPRYTEEEAGRLWAHLGDAPAQVRLLAELAAPALRLGQASKVMRSALDLRLGVGVHGLGVVALPGARGKTSATVALDASARRTVEDALASWLADREAAYRAGEIPDYALIPGRMVDGRAPVGPDALRPISATALRKLYRVWERAAGVEPRGLHAWRRLAAGMAVEESASPTIYDHVGAWRPGSRVRERVYLDAEDLRAREAAEQVRARLRERLRGVRPAPGRPSTEGRVRGRR